MDRRTRSSSKMGSRMARKVRTLTSRLSSRYGTAILLKAKHDGILLKDMAKTMGISASALTQNLQSENLTFETAIRMAIALDAEFSVALDDQTIRTELVPEIEQAIERRATDDDDTKTTATHPVAKRHIALSFVRSGTQSGDSKGLIRRAEVSVV